VSTNEVSCPDLSGHPSMFAKSASSKQVDRRVKPGNDEVS
jgi:hypothetical protein